MGIVWSLKGWAFKKDLGYVSKNGGLLKVARLESPWSREYALKRSGSKVAASSYVANWQLTIKRLFPLCTVHTLVLCYDVWPITQADKEKSNAFPSHQPCQIHLKDDGNIWIETQYSEIGLGLLLLKNALPPLFLWAEIWMNRIFYVPVVDEKVGRWFPLDYLCIDWYLP